MGHTVEVPLAKPAAERVRFAFILIFLLNWVIPKKIHNPPTEEILAIQGGGYLKNVLICM